MQYQNVADYLAEHGYEHRIFGQEVVMTCHVCGKERHLYIENNEGCWHCKVCDARGSWYDLTQALSGERGIKLLSKSAVSKSRLVKIDTHLNQNLPQTFHQQIPIRIKKYLTSDKRGLTEETISRFQLGWDGNNITIPVFDLNGRLVNIRYRRDPDVKKDPKIWNERGSGSTIFNLQTLAKKPKSVVITEGEFDAMIAEQYGFPAVSGTAGASTFKKEWLNYFDDIEKIYICYDTDQAGKDGAKKLANLFGAKGFVVELPSDKDVKNDLTEYFAAQQNKTEDFQKLLRKAKQIKSDEPAPTKKSTQAESMVSALIDEGYELFTDQLGEAYINTSRNSFVVQRVKSNETEKLLFKIFWELTHKPPSNSQVKEAQSTLEGIALFDGSKEIEIHNRVGRYNDELYYDIGDNVHVVKINPNGWSIEKTCPIFFHRFKHQKVQSLPERGGDLKDFLHFANVSSDIHQLLLLTNLAVSFIPDIPRAMPVLHGDPGSSKSTLLKLMRELIDPSFTPLLMPPDNVKELVQIASHNFVVYFDNLSNISRWLSDALCCLVTGISLTKRSLWTDDDDFLYRTKRVIGVCGINQVVTAGDLLNRSIIIPLDLINDKDRKEESELWNDFNRLKPKILGALFDSLSHYLRIAGQLEIYSKPRMADYFRPAAAVADFLGYKHSELEKAFSQNNKSQNEEALDGSSVAQVIVEFMKRQQSSWVGRGSDLYSDLIEVAKDLNLEKSFPKASNWLWRSIKPVRANLLASGIDINKKRTDKANVIEISLTDQFVLPANTGSNGSISQESAEDIINE